MAVQYSEEAEKAMQEAVRKVHEHALSLGELCMAWASLDRTVDATVRALLNCSDDQAAAIIANVESVPARCDIIKRLTVPMTLGADWKSWFLELVKRISSELAPSRNRYVHDHWQLKSGNFIRTDKRTKVNKPQAHAEETLIYDTTHVTPSSEVDRLRQCVEVVAQWLGLAKDQIVSWHETKQPLELHPQWLPVCKERHRLMTLQERNEAAALGQPIFLFVSDPE